MNITKEEQTHRYREQTNSYWEERGVERGKIGVGD